MAMSAFRSTTRRNCQIGSGNASSNEGGGVPSTPRSKRDPSPSGRGFHRRSSSVSDLSAKYLSDCSSTSGVRSSYNKRTGAQGGRRSVCPSDSESDMDFLSAHRPPRRWGAESEDERRYNPPIAATSKAEPDQKGLRRTMSSHDLSQNITKMRHEASVLNTKADVDDPEDLVEEKTIRAVYAQMKSLQVDPPSGDLAMTDFLDAMRSEVRRAVADIRSELEEVGVCQPSLCSSTCSDMKQEPLESCMRHWMSMQSKGQLSSTMTEKSSSDLQRTDVIQAVADVRNEYTTKLEESEKRVRELWSQIAVEERRCLELSKIVKELLPTEPPMPVQNPTTAVASSRRRPLRRKNSEERQLVLKSLDEEALKYFDECVSISSYDCPGDSDDSMREKENNGRKDRRGGVASEGKKLSLTANDARGEKQPRGSSSVESDGVVLPWLQWDAEAGVEKNAKQAAKRPARSRSGSTSPSGRHVSRGSGNTKTNSTRKPATRTTVVDSEGHVSPTRTLAMSTWSRVGVGEIVKEAEALRSKSSTSLFTIDDGAVHSSSITLDLDTLMFERIRLRCRVENGEILLCQGLFLM